MRFSADSRWALWTATLDASGVPYLQTRTARLFVVCKISGGDICGLLRFKTFSVISAVSKPLLDLLSSKACSVRQKCS